MNKRHHILKKICLWIVGIVVVTVCMAFGVLNYYPSIGKLPSDNDMENYSHKTDLFYDKTFHNRNDYSLRTGENSPSSDRQRPSEIIPVNKLTEIPRASSTDFKIVWFGHSSSLLQMGDKNILIDPILSNRSSPVGFVGPSRFSEIAIEPENLPDIDVLFISHDHYDHLDYKTITTIDSKVSHYIVPLGIEVILKGWGVNPDKISSLFWWESVELDGVTYTLTPGQHFSGRNPLRFNATLWGGIHIKNSSHSFYYTGDGGYTDYFKEVYEKLGEVDLILAEDGQYNKAWAQTHMFPEQTVQAAKDVHAKWLIPVHWGAFVLSTHAWDDPVVRALQAAQELNVNMATPRIGEIVDFNEISSYQEHWWEEIE
ncbi:MAG: MBL fold metallo-hydrolase [Faecalicoccus sp.]|nr:MBL fold metallo-hydrolase [Faecalicoccus sp.]